MSQTLFFILDIVVFVVGLLLVVVNFLTYTRKGESEISRDALVSPKFIVGVIMILLAAICGIIF